MTGPTSYNGIAGLTGRQPVGAILRIGQKNDRGVPVDRDRFTIAKTTEEGTGRAKRRPLHPAFAPFNNHADPTHCSHVLIAWMHATREDCHEAYLRNHKAPDAPNPPGRRPFCTGDGVRATRWDGNDYGQIACLEACPYRAPGSGYRGSGRACKPHSRLLAQLVWRDPGRMPSTLIRFSTNSWNTAANLVGYFDWWDSVALQLTLRGADLVDWIERTDDAGKVERHITARRYSMVGARAELTVQERSDQDPRTGEGRRYPVVTISPVDDPVEHLIKSAEAIRVLRDSGRAAVAMLTDDTRRADYLANEVTLETVQTPLGKHTEGSDV